MTMTPGMVTDGLRVALRHYETLEHPTFSERLAADALRAVIAERQAPTISRDAAIAYVLSVGDEIDAALSAASPTRERAE